MKTLGISCFYHDSAVAAIEDGEIKFAIHEERLSRQKHDSRFPIMGISKALEICKWYINDIDEIVFYENPDLKLHRINKQILDGWPKTWRMFSEHLPSFYKFKYPIESIIRDKLRYNGKVSCIEHHMSHAASAFYTSPFDEAIIITVDGVGEFDTTAVFWGEGNSIKKTASIHFPDSLGLLYSVFTQYLGFEVNEGEYKVMGLAPYGKPDYIDKILDKMIILKDDGSYYLNQKYFDFKNRDKHYSDEFVKQLGVPPRQPKGPMTPEYQDIAASMQKVLEIALNNMVGALLKKYPTKNICMAGGVALNCTANAQLVRDFGINLYIQPAAGDAGGALGAAMQAAVKSIDKTPFRFNLSPYLGTEASDKAIETTLRLNDIEYKRVPNIAQEIAKQLADGNIVAILHGRDEWGPRALGGRSILADPRKAGMKDHLNAKIKFREEFRPFAPVIMEEHLNDYFESFGWKSFPYMLFTHKALQPEKIPAAVHADNTSRIQTISKETNSYYYSIIEEFYKITGVPVIINTSFNLKGEPIVSNPSDALKTFYASGIDYLAIEDYFIAKD